MKACLKFFAIVLRERSKKEYGKVLILKIGDDFTEVQCTSDFRACLEISTTKFNLKLFKYDQLLDLTTHTSHVSYFLLH